MNIKSPVLNALHAARGDDWRDAFNSLGFSLLGGVAPLWTGLLVLFFYGRRVHLLDVARNGEFALYTASLIAPVFFLIVKERPLAAFVSRATFALFAVLQLVVAIAAYCLILPVTSKIISPPRLEIDKLATGTVILFGVSLTFALVVTVLNNARSEVSPEKIVESQRRALAKDFDKLGDEK